MFVDDEKFHLKTIWKIGECMFLSLVETSFCVCLEARWPCGLIAKPNAWKIKNV